MTESTKKYVYFFTRQDIFKEYQLVQTSHVAFKLGTVLGDSDVDPDQTYFTCVGVRNLEALEAVQKILTDYKFKYVTFKEEDLNNEATSVATYPIDEDKRDILLAFNLLKFS